MKLTTNGREVSGAIDRVTHSADIGDLGDEFRPALASALAGVVGLVDVKTDPDREITLSANVDSEAATVSVRVGESIAAPDHGNPSIFEASRP